MAFPMYKPPKEIDFTGNVAQKWRVFKNEFNIFMSAAGLDNKPEKRKTSTLLNVIGPRGRAVYDTFEYDENESCEDLATVLEKFEKHCIPRQNELIERQKFYDRTMGKGESVVQYVSALRKLAEHCGFGDAEDGIIRDQVVRMITDSKLKTKLYEAEGLNLGKLIAISTAHEESTKMNDSSSHSIDMVRQNGRPWRQNASRGRVPQRQSRRDDPQRGEPRRDDLRRDESRRDDRRRDEPRRQQDSRPSDVRGKPPCGRCGYLRHFNGRCPAWGKRCTKCNRMNHFAVVCRSNRNNRVHEVTTQEDDPTEYLFVDSIQNKVETQNDWLLDLKLGVRGVKKSFKIDTGSDVNIIPQSVLSSLKEKCEIKPTHARLEGYFGKVAKPLGKVTLQVEFKSKYYPIEFMVVDTDRVPVLGRDTSVELGVVKRVRSVVATQGLLEKYSDVFEGLGTIKGVVYDMKMKPDAKPVVNPPRRVPYALRNRLKESLDNLVKDDVIETVTEPTEWVNPLITVEKPDGKLRLCLDPTELNKAIMREHYPMKTVEEVAATLDGAKVFSVLDASQAFHQIRVSEETSKLLVFNTPFGRYKYKRLPFGICSSPEVWERTAREVFEGIDGVEIIRDEVLVKGKDDKEHNEVLEKTLQRARERGLKFNKDKCEIGVTEVTHQGHVFSPQGVRADPKKVQAIVDFPTPHNVDDVRRFLGIVNYVGKFVPNLSEKTEPLRILLNQKVEWHWDEAQERAMTELKQSVVTAPVLRYYSLEEPVVVSVDASTKGVGACLFQGGKPVHYASRRLTTAEKNYGQIEKEMLAIKFGCEKFHDYIYGHQDVTIETDHKPLECLYKKPLTAAPPRIQRMMLKLLKYTFKVTWKEGKSMIVPDALSRSPIDEIPVVDEEFVVLTVKNLPISDVRIAELKAETVKDMTMQMLHQYVVNGWPEQRSSVHDEVKPYWNVRDELYVSEGLLLKNERLVVPTSMRHMMLNQVHRAHLGAEKCIARAKDVFYWPGMAAQIKDMCEQCSVCAEYRPKQMKEPMVLTQLPERPWQKLGSDLFQFDGKTYVLLADYYSKFVEFTELKEDQESSTVIEFFKEQFARHGIPEQVITDGGPQYSSRVFRDFATCYGFQHIMSSPEYPQSNGFAESQVKVLKNIMKKAKKSNTDLCLALLEWRNTPIQGLGSPAQLVLGRRTRTTLPTTMKQLRPQPVTVKLTDVLADKQQKQKVQYDKHARSERDVLSTGDHVRMRTQNGWVEGKIVQARPEPRSYEVERNSRVYRRNRRDIMSVPQSTVSKSAVVTDNVRGTNVPKSDVSVGVHTGVRETVTNVPKKAVTIRVPSPPVTGPTTRVSRVSGRTIRTPLRYQ